MILQQLTKLTGFALLLGTLAVLGETIGQTGGQVAAPIRIGILADVIKDVPDAAFAAMQQPFNTVMTQQTGLSGQLVRSGDADELARQLAADKVQLGIFYGIDFAWVRQQHPGLKPLMICINKHHELRAKVVVCTESKAAGFADLHGQTLVLPKRDHRHCQVYLAGLCRGQGVTPEQFAGKIQEAEDFEEALDQVVNGAAQATVIDQAALECYQRLKPGRFAWLKVLEKSAAFPCGCVAYHPRSGIDPATLGRFRQGMTNSNQTYLGKRMLSLFRMSAFESVPADYEQRLKEVLKLYPASPESEAVGTSSNQ